MTHAERKEEKRREIAFSLASLSPNVSSPLLFLNLIFNLVNSQMEIYHVQNYGKIDN